MGIHLKQDCVSKQGVLNGVTAFAINGEIKTVPLELYIEFLAHFWGSLTFTHATE